MKTTQENTNTKLFTGIPVIEFAHSMLEKSIIAELEEKAKKAWVEYGWQSDQHREKSFELWDYDFSLVCKSMDNQFSKVNKFDSVKIARKARSAFDIWAKERDVRYRILSINENYARIIITQI